MLGRPQVWVLSNPGPLEDVLLLFSVMGSKVPEVRAVLGEFEKSRNRSGLDINASFPKGFPRYLYAANQKHLKGWHVVVSVGDPSHAKNEIQSLERYASKGIEFRETMRFQRRSIRDL